MSAREGRPVPRCACLTFSVLLVFGAFIGWEYYSHKGAHVKNQVIALARDQEICADPVKVKKLHFQKDCHAAAHDLETHPHDFAVRMLFRSYALESWMDWGLKYFSTWAVFYFFILVLIFKPLLEWCFNKGRMEYIDPLIPQ